jgi:hypothetical protein
MTTGLDSIDYYVTGDVFVSDTHAADGGNPTDDSEITITYDYMSSRPAMMMEQMVRLRGIAATPLTTEELQVPLHNCIGGERRWSVCLFCFWSLLTFLCSFLVLVSAAGG